MPVFKENAVVQLQGVGFTYHGVSAQKLPPDVDWALKPVDLDVYPGMWLAIAGANGSGKSTLARLVAGLHWPTKGTVRVGGVPTTAPEFHPAQLGMGYLSQHPEEHVVGLTIADDVALGPLNLGLPAGEIEERVREALFATGLGGLPRGTSTQHLSGGEVQRLALAGVLAMRPSVFILDEPTVACDPALRKALRASLRVYVERHHAAVIWVTHDPDEIKAADKVVVLDGGEIVFRGTPDQLGEKQKQGSTWGLAPLHGPDMRRSDGVAGLSASVSSVGKEGTEKGRQVVLKMEGVRFAYPASDEPVLDGLDLVVHSGEVVPLVGASGAGKTTLIQLAAMLEPHQEGRLAILDQYVPKGVGRGGNRRARRAVVERLRSHVAVSFQMPEQQLFGITVREDFEFGLRHFDIDPTLWPDRMRKALASVGLSSAFLDRSPFALSGGEKRRVAMALCLAQQPDLYLLDEPTAGLDHPSTSILLQAIDELMEEQHCGVLLASHDRPVIRRWHQHAVFLSARRIAADPTGDVVNAFVEASPTDRGVPEEASDPQSPNGPGRWLRRVDPRARLLGAAMVAAAIATVRNPSGLAVAAGMVALWFILSAYPIRAGAATLRGLMPFLLAAIIFGGLTFDNGSPSLATSGLIDGTLTAGRIALLVLSVSWLTHIGGISEMLWAMGTLLTPLQRVGFPVASLTGAAVVGIRMMPLLGEEARRIRKSQIARGVERIKGWRGHWVRAASLVIPLSASLFRRAERLGEALHLRGFQGGISFGSQGGAQGGWQNAWFLLVALAGTLVIVIAN